MCQSVSEQALCCTTLAILLHSFVDKFCASAVRVVALAVADTEDALVRAEQAEQEATQLRGECKSLSDRLQAYSLLDLAPAQRAEAQSSNPQDDSSPSPSPDSPPTQTSASTLGNTSKHSARLVELSQQLEAAATLRSTMEAGLAGAHAELKSQSAELASTKATLSTEVAILSEQTQALTTDKDELIQRLQQLDSERGTLSRQAEQLTAEIAEVTQRAESATAERDSFAERALELESALSASTQAAEGLRVERDEVHQQVAQLQEKVQGLEEEAQENFDRFSEKEEVSTLMLACV